MPHNSLTFETAFPPSTRQSVALATTSTESHVPPPRLSTLVGYLIKSRDVDEEGRAKLEIDLLMKEYAERRAEIMQQLQRYDKQGTYINIYTTFVVAISGVLLSVDTSRSLSTAKLVLDSRYAGGYYAILLIFGLIIAYYYYLNVLDILSMIYVNAAPVGAIEQRVNAAIGSDLLIWDHKIIARYFDIRFWHYKMWIKPAFLVAVWVFGFVIVMSSLICFICYALLPGWFWPFLTAVVSLTTFQLYQWIELHRTGIQFIRTFVYKCSGVGIETADLPGIKKEYWIPFLTFLSGFCVFLGLSIRDHAFWVTSRHQFPLVLIPSILIADSILLPLFNLRMFQLLKDYGAAVRRFPNFLTVWSLFAVGAQSL